MAQLQVINNDNNEQIEYEDITVPDVERLTRDDFVQEVFAPNYEAGQHVTIVGPTGTGKTTLAFEMLDAVAKPDLPAVILVKKPKDDVINERSKQLGFKRVEQWPPMLRRGWKNKHGGIGKKRRGFVYWPRHNLRDLRKDKKQLSRNFERAITECYRRGNRILFVDDLVGFSKEYNLEEPLTVVYMEGRAMGCGLWGAIQRPFHAPVIMYGAAEHVILFNDPDKRSIERYKEIGGIDENLVVELTRQLRKHQFLYIGRNMGKDGVSPGIAIVDSS